MNAEIKEAIKWVFDSHPELDNFSWIQFYDYVDDDGPNEFIIDMSLDVMQFNKKKPYSEENFDRYGDSINCYLDPLIDDNEDTFKVIFGEGRITVYRNGNVTVEDEQTH